jgi:hypothetical protein
MRQPNGYDLAKCFGKQALSREKARKIVVRMQRQHVRNANTLTFYRCDVCRRWHVGNDYRRNVA